MLKRSSFVEGPTIKVLFHKSKKKLSKKFPYFLAKCQTKGKFQKQTTKNKYTKKQQQQHHLFYSINKMFTFKEMTNNKLHK